MSIFPLVQTGNSFETSAGGLEDGETPRDDK